MGGWGFEFEFFEFKFSVFQFTTSKLYLWFILILASLGYTRAVQTSTQVRKIEKKSVQMCKIKEKNVKKCWIIFLGVQGKQLICVKFNK